MSKKLTNEQWLGLQRMKFWYMMKGTGMDMLDYVDLNTDTPSLTYMQINEMLSTIPNENEVVFGERELQFLNLLREYYIKNK